MSTYAWIITHVNVKELGEDMADEVGVAGPRDATPEDIERAKSEGVTFRMSDDDNIWYYRGKLWFPGIEAPRATPAGPGWRVDYLCAGMGGDEEQEFGPLNDFGMPNAGCVHIDFRCTVSDPDEDDGSTIKVWAIL